MNKVISREDIPSLKQYLQKQNKNITLVGGCFDILHPGHIAFLQAAKGAGGALVVLLESDVAIRSMKGEGRPTQTQIQRAEALSALSFIDYILLLKGKLTDGEYDELILALKPAIIATTRGDEYKHHKERQSRLANSRVVEVIGLLPEYSTTKLIRRFEKI